MRRVMLVGVLAALLATGYMLSQSRKVRIVEGSAPYVLTYAHSTRGLVGAMAAGDGQAYAALAQDPTMARPSVFVDGRTGAAYRYQRPLLGYLAWAGSLGRPEWEPGAQGAVVVLGAAVAVAACAEILRRRRREPLLALLVLLVPGMSSSLSGLTAEPVALAFLTLGVLAWWNEPRRTVVAIVCLVLATLSRESSLIAVAALSVVELLRARRAGQPLLPQRVVPLVMPFGAYFGWALVVRLRLGAFPFDTRGNLSAIPFDAVARSLSSFADPSRSWLWLLVGVALVGVAVARRNRDPLAVVVVIFALFGAFMGTAVWHRWQDFSRPLLPLYAFGALIALSWLAPVRGGSHRERAPG